MMTPLLVMLGATVGAPLRWWMGQRFDAHWPWGTFLVNVAGCFGLGACAGWGLTGDAMALVGVGFFGALTTYSTFALQTHQAGWVRGSAYAALTIAVSVAAAVVGFALTS